ncbi:potassium transporter Kup [Kitasatospora mediocidica]|uniref:potassium transporter Kup n=1 Tax=Kitasatospora mediocidica TaxID=58352 RepID=UPI00055A54FF|nr:potassium transporter Kup [Kitasatospora mediocidica]
MSIEAAKSAPESHRPSHRPGLAALTLGALGVVFGDIGTSPLYAIQTVFTADGHAVGTSPDEVYGVISLVFWAITLIVSVKYVTFILRADNGGEGGIMALTALVQKLSFKSARTKVILVALGIFGASLFYGDGMITPAISVLSAVEGLKVAAPGLSSLVVPATIAVLVLLFAIQRYGTTLVGNLFGPVMAVWFLILATAGGFEVANHPAIFQALSPLYGLRFIVDHGMIAFVALASVVLAVTGAEALYADMGHFGRSPIHRAWFFMVFPALTLNYLGQGSLILRSPSAVANPFFLMLPGWAQIPMVVLATIATVIASQAVISGAFSVTRQAVQLGFLPHLTIRHTSEHEVGQVYAPVINWGLFGAVVALVVGFGSSAALASAYGVAVTATFVLNTVLFLAVARNLMRKPIWLVALGAVVFLTTEIAFFAANLTKVVHGGWLPLLVAFTIFTILITWQRGRQIVTPNRTALEGPLRAFVDEVDAMDPPVHRVDGTAVFLNANIETTPLALRANVEHNHTLHKNVVILSVVVERVPTVPESERCAFDDLGHSDDGITHLTARFGFQDEPNIPQVLRLAAQHPDAGEIHGLRVDEVSYFLSRMTIIRTDTPGMRRWRKKLFLAISNNASSPVVYFGLPSDRCVIMGAQVSV